MPVTPDFARLTSVIEELDQGLEADLVSGDVTDEELREARSLLDATIARLDQVRARLVDPHPGKRPSEAGTAGSE
jgi:hypothetical protein